MNKNSFKDTKLYRSLARIMPVNPISIQVKSCTVLVFKSWIEAHSRKIRHAIMDIISRELNSILRTP